MLDLIKMKTFWAGLALVGYGVVQAAQGDVEAGVRGVLEGLAIIFLRQGVAKAAPKKAARK